MRKLLLGFIVLSVALLTACTGQFNTGLKFSTNEDVLSFQALIASTLLPSTQDEALSGQYNVMRATLVNTEAEEVDEEVEEPTDAEIAITNIDPYVELIEKILGTNQGLNVTVLASTEVDYEFMMTFETSGLLGENQTYVIHYNMTLKDDVEDVEDTDDVEETDDAEDDESEFVLDGIMVFNDQVYTLLGKREVEEGEDKIEFTAKLDDLNYIETEYKLESEETKFEIKVVNNGIVVSETEIKIEDEEDGTKVELEFLSGDNKGKYEFEYEVEDGQNVLKVEFDIEIDGINTKGDITLLVLVDEITGETYYQAYVEVDGDDEVYEEEIERDIDDEDDDDDDNEETEDNEESVE
jgi:hypothetical protein